MRTKPYIWTPGDEPPVIQPHSIAKHEVLAAYLEKYVEVVAANPAIESLKLTLVDGFAGGGLYTRWDSGDIHLGSPFIMLKSMRAAEARLNSSRRKKFSLDVQYFFVEKNQAAADYLKSALKKEAAGNEMERRIHVLSGTFEENLDQLIGFVRSRDRARRCIFVLDQYGYSDVPMRLLSKITRLPKAEVILTFATDWLIDYLSDSLESRQLRRRLGLDLRLDLRELKEDRPKEWRRIIEFALHGEIQGKSGARFYTPFFIVSQRAHRAYWLVHLSGHARARDVMVGLHWQKQNYFAHYGRPGLRMLGYDSSKDPQITGQFAFPEFSFDKTAQKRTTAALLEEIPQWLQYRREGIPFFELFADLTNETPASSEIMRSALGELAKRQEVEIIDPDTQKRRKSTRVRNKDLIRTPNQRLLFSLK